VGSGRTARERILVDLIFTGLISGAESAHTQVCQVLVEAKSHVAWLAATTQAREPHTQIDMQKETATLNRI
jgi:hypothetical protein